MKIHLLRKNGEVPFGATFSIEKNRFFQRKYRFSRNWYTILVPKFEIGILSEKLNIVLKNHLDSPKGRYWPFILVRYLRMTQRGVENTRVHFRTFASVSVNSLATIEVQRYPHLGISRNRPKRSFLY